MKTVRILILLLMFAGITFSENSNKIHVMILGTYHMANPGLDLHNMKADDVTQPHRQKELADVAERLAKFRPTKIALERNPTNQDFVDDKYAQFRPEQLLEIRDERIQIGYRLAHLLKHERVFAIDERSDEIDYFPFGKVQKFAEENGRAEFLANIGSEIEAKVKKFEAAQKEKSIGELLTEANEPAEIQRDQSLGYYSLLRLSKGEQHPGAELNSYWYMRNAKIFSKLLQIARPGDRIVVLFGAGHNYWLRHFAQNTDGLVLVEPNRYLPGRGER